MTVEILLEKDYTLYDEFINNYENSMMYHTLKYKKLLEEYLKCISCYYIVKSNNKIDAVMPMFIKSGTMGNVYNSLPFYGSNGAILAKTKKSFQILIKKYNEIALYPETLSITLITNPLDLKYDYQEMLINETDERYSQWTNLDYAENYEEMIMQSFHTKTRNMVRKSLKYNFKFVIDKDFDTLYDVHVKNMNEIGGLAKEKEYFNHIKKVYKFNKDYIICSAVYEDSKVASLLLFLHKDTVEYYTPVIKKEYRNTQALTYLIYKSMIYYSKKGYKKWNWGGTWKSQDGVYRFKSRLGGIDKNYKYYTYVNNKEIYTTSKEYLLKEYKNFYVLPFNRLKEC